MGKIKFIIVFMAFIFAANSNAAFADGVKTLSKYPDWGQEYLGNDKFENFNRKMFILNGALNKYALRPLTVVWSSVMPKYGMDRLKMAYSNILYPRKLVSFVVQKDFKGAKDATVRFLTNSTIGLGGMFDPAKRFLKIKPVNEDMGQALAKFNIKQGPYLVVPILSSSTPRELVGKALDAALDPTSYIGTPALAAVKAGFTVNNAALMQPLTKMIEDTYADPYDIVKKLYGLQCAIHNSNLDREDKLKETDEQMQKVEDNPSLNEIAEKEENLLEVSTEEKTQESSDKETIAIQSTIKGSASTDEILFNDELIPDIILEGFNPQGPVIDSMRTALFDLPDVDDSIWGEFSIWNRSFKNRIKTSSVEITPNRDEYKFKYIMQKDKNSPLAIIYPSIGEGINSHHSILFAKLFYDEGYSVVIQGSSFHFEFQKSMPEDYRPGLPSKDANYLRKTTSKIVEKLEDKYECKFKDKVMLGTSFGAITSLFVAKQENDDNNSLGISKYISINPPVELVYAMEQIDSNSEEWNKNPNNLKQRTSVTAAKILQTVSLKDEENVKIETLPFSSNEAKIITGFILHQKLSDLLFAINNVPITKKTDIYETINNTSYKDYADKYLVDEKNESLNSFSRSASLYSISDFLKTSSRYKIYHSMDDYLVNYEQLKVLKKYAGNKMTLIDKGSHLGFLYRKEFIDALKKEIALAPKAVL